MKWVVSFTLLLLLHTRPAERKRIPRYPKWVVNFTPAPPPSHGEKSLLYRQNKGCRAGVGVVLERKILTCRELNPGCPGHSQLSFVTYESIILIREASQNQRSMVVSVSTCSHKWTRLSVAWLLGSVTVLPDLLHLQKSPACQPATPRLQQSPLSANRHERSCWVSA